MKMKNIYVAIMDNGSGDMIIRSLSCDPVVALKRLQDDFIEWRKDELEEMVDEGLIKDALHPTLAEMKLIINDGVEIIEVLDGTALYEELRNFEFKNCNSLQGDDPRLAP
jgi:hypothetical protein